MARLMWQKHEDEHPDQVVQRFLCGDDRRYDQLLLPYDIRATRAHVRGLGRIEMLAEAEVEQLIAALDQLDREQEAGEFLVDERYEDSHSAIEDQLIERLGEVGMKVHLGRSRNDQVLAALRLYEIDALVELERQAAAIAAVFLDRAAAEVDTPMPGYTHLQRAVPSSAAMWLASFAEGFIDDALLARATRQWIDSSPLGTAAGYGVNLPLDRAGVAAELGHSRLQISPIYAQASRGKLELQLLMAMAQALVDVRRFAWDLSLFTTAEFGFVRLPERFTTGSSIMPNKRNPDVVELLRAAAAAVFGAMVEIEAVISLPSGYHRDLQATKGPLLRAVTAGLPALVITCEVARGFELDRSRMAAAISPEMYATDRAVELAAAGTPFRETYRQVGSELDQLSGEPQASLRARVSPGGAAELMLDELHRRLATLES